MVLFRSYLSSLLRAVSQTTPLLLLHYRLAYHDIQWDVAPTTLEIDSASLLEPKLSVNRRIARVTTLQIARPALPIRKTRNMLDQLASMAFTASAGLGAKVNEVPGFVLAGTERGVHRVVEEGQEFVEEATFAFSRETVVEAPHTGAENGQVVVHVLAGWHPV
jgi:hypothetical protein